jgi:uncharacterized protein YgfB (UPF0149 family)
MTSNTDRFTQIEAALALASIDLSPSEAHATVVGAIANHMKTGLTPDLLTLIEPNASSTMAQYAQLNVLLHDLYRENGELLIEGKEDFDILLPSDEEPLEVRTESLAAWARGFLLGLLYNNVFSIDQLPESGAEIARDMLQISEASAGADDEKVEDFALAELHEYLKVGAQLIFEFIYAERASKMPAQAQ